MAHDTYPRWTAHPGRALHDTRYRRPRRTGDRGARAARAHTPWTTLAVGSVWGLVAAGVILATAGAVGLVAHRPQAVTTWSAVAAVVLAVGLLVPPIVRAARRHPS